MLHGTGATITVGRVTARVTAAESAAAALSIQLLGPPRMQRDGAAIVAPRGHKAWGLLAYLLRSRVPPSRERLAGLLFPEADDPLGTLRWTLSALRRSLGPGVELGGDPVRLALPPDAFVDVHVLAGGSWMEAVGLPGLGHELLDGLAFRGSPGFEMWLESERRHVAGMSGAVLHQAALALLARGDADGAAAYAAELAGLSEFDENAQVLLVRCLRAAGRPREAARHVAACTERFRRELGVEPTPALRAAAAATDVEPGTRVSGRAAAAARLQAGEAALAAGAVETGLERIRGAVMAAREGGDPELLARTLVALGGALVHAARGTDEEGAAALHEATAIAEAAGLRANAARAWREIGWVQFLRAHYERAEASLTVTEELADGDPEALAWVALIRGACRHDVGDHEAAAPLLADALARAEALDAPQPLGQALTLLGRFHLLRGDREAACALFDRALEEAAARGMTAFVPWPEAFRAEIDLADGDVGAAEARLEHAFALGCQVGDPCWESVSLRGLGLAAAARGDVARALELLVEAPRLCRRLPDTYRWIEVYGLDALCAVAVEHRSPAAPRWIAEFEAVAARRGIRELLLHAAVYRTLLGEPGAGDAARSLAAQIANPALADLVP